MKPFRVIFYPEAIQIVDDEEQDEIVYWDMLEWTEDPEVVFSIANAVRLAYTEPRELVELLKTDEV